MQDKEDIRIFNMDCVQGCKQKIQDESVDLIVCDPPFGINESTFDKHYNRIEKDVVCGYVEAPSNYSSFSNEWITECKRILKPNGSMYIISGWSELPSILNAISANGLKVINHIVWKFNFGVYTKNKFVTSHYHILYVSKPKAKPYFNKNCRFGDQEKDDGCNSLVYKDMEDVWLIKKEYKPGQTKNKNQLPEALLEKIILYSSKPGDVVCDLFLGGFTTAKVARKLGRKSWGFELNKEAFSSFSKDLINITYGEGIERLKKVVNIVPENQGKGWSKDESGEFFKCYSNMRGKGVSKKECIGFLCNKFGRGKFSVEKKIKNNEA